MEVCCSNVKMWKRVLLLLKGTVLVYVYVLAIRSLISFSECLLACCILPYYFHRAFLPFCAKSLFLPAFVFSLCITASVWMCSPALLLLVCQLVCFPAKWRPRAKRNNNKKKTEAKTFLDCVYHFPLLFSWWTLQFCSLTVIFTNVSKNWF